MRSTHARIISKRNSRQTRRGEKQEEGGERKVIKKVMEGGGGKKRTRCKRAKKGRVGEVGTRGSVVLSPPPRPFKALSLKLRTAAALLN